MSAAVLGARTRRAVARLDWWLLLAAGLLLTFGLMSMYSYGGGFFGRYVQRLLIGLIPFGLFLWVPIGFWRRAAVVLYVLNIALLVLVLIAGASGGGAQRWLNIGPVEFQPSELSKLLNVICLAAYFASRPEPRPSLGAYGVSLLLALPSFLLVFKQPHLGATLVLIVAWLSVSLYAGVRWRYIVATLAAAGVLFLLALTIYPKVLHSYQRDRVKALFVRDAAGRNFQQDRAAIAFGAGGLTGKGYLRGEQKAGGYIPEQETDFVFTIIGEEGGLVGASLVLATFALFFFRLWLVLYRATDRFGRSLAGGVIAVLAFHMIANLGMNLLLLPVVGLWLPFLSYGGTALWLVMACTGLMLRLGAEQPGMFASR